MIDVMAVLMRRGLVASILLLLLCSGKAALACSCGAPWPAQAVLERTPVIFTGVAVAEVIDAAGSSVATRFAVSERIKGEVGDAPVVITQLQSSMCGFRFRLNVTTIVWADPDPESALQRFWAGGCRGPSSLQHEQLDALLAATLREATRLQAALAAAPDDPASQLAWARYLERIHDARADRVYAAIAATQSDAVAGHLGLARLALRRRAVAEAGTALAAAGTGPETAKLLDMLRLVEGDVAPLGTRRDWQGLEIERLDLSGRDFRRADLRDARVANFTAQGADLRDARFEGSVFYGADLKGADLRGVSLAQLAATNLDLSDTRLDGARLSEVSLAGARLAGANLSRATGEGVDFRRANLRQAVLRQARLPGAQFREANLAGADLSGAGLVGANLDWANLAGANLSGATIRGASFELAIYDCSTRLPAGVTAAGLGMVHATPNKSTCR
jgi:uncharacterized protein YjbI with pentapeptide repeats